MHLGDQPVQWWRPLRPCPAVAQDAAACVETGAGVTVPLGVQTAGPA